TTPAISGTWAPCSARRLSRRGRRPPISVPRSPQRRSSSRLAKCSTCRYRASRGMTARRDCEPATSNPAGWQWNAPTARTSQTGGGNEWSVLDRDEAQHATVANHRRFVLVPVRMLAGDLAVQRLEAFRGRRRRHEFGRTVRLNPRSEEAVGEDADRGPVV